MLASCQQQQPLNLYDVIFDGVMMVNGLVVYQLALGPVVVFDSRKHLYRKSNMLS